MSTLTDGFLVESLTVYIIHLLVAGFCSVAFLIAGYTVYISIFEMRLRLHKPLFFVLVPIFVLAVVVGTLHHETGHYLAAKCMGLKASIHYDFTHVEAGSDTQQLTIMQLFWFIIAGPLQTMLTGTAALVLLYIFNHRQRFTTFSRYLLVFVALFWIRQLVNFSLGLSLLATTRQYPQKGDEAKLSLYFHLPVWCLNAATAIVGLIIIAIVIFRFVPVQQRFTFWLAGTIGGAVGYFVWIVWLGKYILP